MKIQQNIQLLIVIEDLDALKMTYTVVFAQDEFRKTAKISALYDREINMLGGTYSNMQSGFTRKLER